VLPRLANLCIFSRDGFHHVGQAGDPPTSASQSVGITGVSHCLWPEGLFLEERADSRVGYCCLASKQGLHRAA
uniref:Uncharacterized protein n=1 Tax=Mandrillus leucophaeus TaxID=9568 RepID=A0A2K6ACX9_MANLE